MSQKKLDNGFEVLANKVVRETPLPGPDIQVYQQDISRQNGLWVLKSGRLLSTAGAGSFPRRIKRGVQSGSFFEIQRTGEIMPLDSDLGSPERINPVHGMVDTVTAKNTQVRWFDSEMKRVHEAVTHINDDPDEIITTVLTWRTDCIEGRDFTERAYSSLASKYVCYQGLEWGPDEHANSLVESAISAYTQATSTS